MSLVYLVGTNHMDLKGPERLRKFLGFVRPDQVCLEASPELIQKTLAEREIMKAEMEKEKKFTKMMERYHNLMGIKKEKRSNEDFVLRFLSTLRYEIWVPHEYKETNNHAVKIIPIDMHEDLVKGQEFYKRAFGNERMNIEELSKVTDIAKIQETIDRAYLEADHYYANNPQEREQFSSLHERDNGMELRIRETVEKNGVPTTVVICGNHHFFADYDRNLYERLKDLSPVRVRLPELDNF